ncbi:MAG: protein YgfX [Acinetobacter sp.]
MAKRCFQLQTSRWARLVDGLFFILIGSILYMLLIFWLWLLCIFLMLISYAYFHANKKQISQFEYLADNDWSLYDLKKQNTERVQIEKILDHQVYIVIYFQHKQPNLVIWQDQLSSIEWKNLKVLAKLH